MLVVTVLALSENTSWDPSGAGAKAIREVGHFIDGLPSELASNARLLMDRHGYTVGPSGDGPHTNVLGHPLFELPIWINSATNGSGDVEGSALLDICFSSLFGYLSVRADDDYFDGHWDDSHSAMMLSAVFRTRHQTLLAAHTSDRRFWRRFEDLWEGYAEAMLVESRLHEPDAAYGPQDFDRVLARSQPLEIPAMAVLALRDRLGEEPGLARLVRHLVKATQLFDDFVDAPEDLARGNYTWLVRRLGGLDGDAALRKGMVRLCDKVISEAISELDSAVAVGSELGLAELPEWVDDRKSLMIEAANRMYQGLFEAIEVRQRQRNE